eukprot:TRINITY_DN183_c2_g1_i7.p1 TRINITY_DN183_c2_g1~~TRINITY_DN183_c2_g1_i7.p1  ORF type:complete len:106 (-),score=17.93 TRINITY_DN183_c2_g1_i7:92-409(-)
MERRRRLHGIFKSAYELSYGLAAMNRWDSQGYFKPSFDRGGDPFVISMPPPNVTGSLHMGHAMFVTVEVRESKCLICLLNVHLNYYRFILAYEVITESTFCSSCL